MLNSMFLNKHIIKTEFSTFKQRPVENVYGKSPFHNLVVHQIIKYREKEKDLCLM